MALTNYLYQENSSKMLAHDMLALSWLSESSSASAPSQISVPNSDLTYEAGSWGYTQPGVVCSDGVRHSTGILGSRVSLQFEGTGIDLYLPRGPKGATIEVDLDGEKVNLDTRFSPYDCNTPVYAVSNLAFDNHTVKVQTMDRGTLYVSKFVYTIPDISLEGSGVARAPIRTAAAVATFHYHDNLRIIFGAVVGLLLAAVWAFIRHRRRRTGEGTLPKYINVAYGAVKQNASDSYDASSKHTVEQSMKPTSRKLA